MVLFSTLGFSLFAFFTSFFTQTTFIKPPIFATKISQFISPHPSMNNSIPKEVSPAITDQDSPPPPAVVSDQKQFFIDQINKYRNSLGLSSVEINDQTCSFAQTRAQEIATDFSHTGFFERVHANTLPYSHYALITENIAETPQYQDVVALWKNSPEHAANMRADTPYVCVQRYGNYYAYEGLRIAQ